MSRWKEEGGRGQRDDSVSAVNLGSFFVRLVFTFIISFGILSFFSNHFFSFAFIFTFLQLKLTLP